MNDSMEKILKDIYQLDPSLKDRDVEVRNIVKSLIAEKPAVTISESFTKSLRAELVSPPVVASKATPKNTAWWMFYLAPVGVAALVLFILAPHQDGPSSRNSVPTMMEEGLDVDDYSQSYDYAADEQPQLKQAAPAMESATMMMSPEAEAGNSGVDILVLNQTPGEMVLVDSVLLSVPGYVAIHKDNGGELGEMIGVSSLLSPGSSQQVIVPLRLATEIKQSYLAVLYFDNGSGAFEASLDLPIFSGSNDSPVMQSFAVTLEDSI